MTIQKIVEIEPRVKAILDEAAQIKQVKPYDYPRYKDRLELLVGWEADNEKLRSSSAYCVTIRALSKALKI